MERERRAKMSASQKSASDWIDVAMEELAKTSWAGPEDLVIWGGSFLDIKWTEFFAVWQAVLQERLPWRIEETVSQTATRKATPANAALPADTYSLERLRCFGPDGDLDLRRDHETIHWRFIGDLGKSWPELPKGIVSHDFWQEQPEGEKVRFRVVQKSYYQWRPNDRRVSTQWYSLADRSPDLYLEQIHYLRQGQTAFVRFTGFTPVKKGG
jgi:hypothetical protein